MKRVLVTGATGFIGNYIVNDLINKGFNVIATSSNKKKAETSGWFKKVTYIPFNLDTYNDSDNYFDFFSKPDLMIHLAWEGLPNYNAEFHVKENLPRHKLFLKNLITHGLKDLTVTGTCLEYGMQEGCLNEEMPALPITNYAIAKNELHSFMNELQSTYQFNLKWVRLFYMYGKGQSSKSLISQLEVAIDKNEEYFNMSGGVQIRDFLKVEEMANYIIAIGLQNNVVGTINCCSGNPISVKDLVLNFMKDHQKSIKLNLGYYPYVEYEPMSFWGDNKKLLSIINANSSNNID